MEPENPSVLLAMEAEAFVVGFAQGQGLPGLFIDGYLTSGDLDDEGSIVPIGEVHAQFSTLAPGGGIGSRRGCGVDNLYPGDSGCFTGQVGQDGARAGVEDTGCGALLNVFFGDNGAHGFDLLPDVRGFASLFEIFLFLFSWPLAHHHHSHEDGLTQARNLGHVLIGDVDFSDDGIALGSEEGTDA